MFSTDKVSYFAQNIIVNSVKDDIDLNEESNCVRHIKGVCANTGNVTITSNDADNPWRISHNIFAGKDVLLKNVIVEGQIVAKGGGVKLIGCITDRVDARDNIFLEEGSTFRIAHSEYGNIINNETQHHSTAPGDLIPSKMAPDNHQPPSYASICSDVSLVTATRLAISSVPLIKDVSAYDNVLSFTSGKSMLSGHRVDGENVFRLLQKIEDSGVVLFSNVHRKTIKLDNVILPTPNWW